MKLWKATALVDKKETKEFFYFETAEEDDAKLNEAATWKKAADAKTWETELEEVKGKLKVAKETMINAGYVDTREF